MCVLEGVFLQGLFVSKDTNAFDRGCFYTLGTQFLSQQTEPVNCPQYCRESCWTWMSIRLSIFILRFLKVSFLSGCSCGGLDPLCDRRA